MQNEAADEPVKGQELSDAEVLASVAKGDFEQFDLLIRRHIRSVTLLADRLVGDRDEAEDIAEEAFLVVMRQAAMFDPAEGDLRRWLYGIVQNIARRHRIKENRRRTLWERWAPGRRSDPGPGERIEARDILDKVTKVLSNLPDMQRQCFQLNVIDGFSIAEVSHMYQISEATVRQHVFRARRALREWLESTSGSRKK